MRKFIVTILSAVMCFAAITVMTGCADTSALEARIAQLEQDLADVREAGGIKGDTGEPGPQGSKGQDGAGVVTNTIYNIGNTVTVSAHGYELFKIRFDKVMQDGVFWVFLTVTNINMPSIRCTNYIAISYLRADGTFMTPGSNTDTQVIPNGQTDEFLLSTGYGNLNNTPPRKIYLGFPNANNAPFIPYAIFNVS